MTWRAQSGRVGVRGVGQPEEASDGVEQGMRAGGVGSGRHGAEGAPRVVEELVAEPRHGSRDRGAVRMAQVGAGGEEAIELAPQRDLRAAADLANHGGGVTAVGRGCRADGRAASDGRHGTPGRLSAAGASGLIEKVRSSVHRHWRRTVIVCR
jgi:hypothetical protein